MIARVAWVLILSAVVSLPAQSPASSLPSLLICDDRNGQSDLVEGTWVPQLTLPGAFVPGKVAVRVVPATGLNLEGVETLVSSPALVPGFIVLARFEVYAEDPTSGLPDAGPLAQSGLVTLATPLANGLSWTGATFPPGTTLTAGTPYWVVLDEFSGSGLTFGTQNQSGPDATPLAIGNPGLGLPWGLQPVNERVKLRLLATTCPVASNASVVPVGAGCPVGAAPTLLTSGLPTIGNAGFSFLINSVQTNQPAALFWAPTADPVGTPVTATGCRLHLDLAGTLLLINAGLNPILSGQTGLTGVATFAFPIPADPALDGFSAAFQGVVVGPSPSLTAALVAMVGF